MHARRPNLLVNVYFKIMYCVKKFSSKVHIVIVLVCSGNVLNKNFILFSFNYQIFEILTFVFLSKLLRFCTNRQKLFLVTHISTNFKLVFVKVYKLQMSQFILNSHNFKYYCNADC